MSKAQNMIAISGEPQSKRLLFTTKCYTHFACVVVVVVRTKKKRQKTKTNRMKQKYGCKRRTFTDKYEDEYRATGKKGSPFNFIFMCFPIHILILRCRWWNQTYLHSAHSVYDEPSMLAYDVRCGDNDFQNARVCRAIVDVSNTSQV